MAFLQIILIVVIAVLLYKFFTRNFDYWERKGVPYVKPYPFAGNILDVVLMRISIGHLLAKFYNTFQTPYFGLYVLNKPHLVLRDPDLIKTVLVKDFNNFDNHSVASDEKSDSIAANVLFAARNPKWKVLRTKVSPAFSSGKIKNMLALIEKAAIDMTKYVEQNCSQSSLEAKEICAKYATDVVASCAFGIDAHCFENENAIFRIIGTKIFDYKLSCALRQMSYFVLPEIVPIFKIPFFEKSVREFLRDVIWETVNERKKTGLKRNDIIDTLIQIQQQSTPSDPVKFDGDVIVAQAGQFYTAGFETVSSTMGFTLYELALNPEIQAKAREEVKAIINKYGSVTYEAIQDMKYLNMIVYETLRMYPVLPFLDRCCKEDYKLPNSDLVIEKGTAIYIPMFGLHYDPTYFPEPKVYNPERFSDENKHKIPPFAYIPFGEGPRSCIGERLGMLVTKLGLAHMLQNFEVKRNSLTPVPIEYETKTVLLLSKAGLPVTFKKI